MKTKLNLVAAGLFLAALGTGFGQPVITQQPQSCTNVVGTTATFTVLATGTEPLAYQWQKTRAEWSDLADCTNAALVLTNVQTSHAGDYRVVVTNAEGAVTSQVAQLTVVAAQPLSSPCSISAHGRLPGIERFVHRRFRAPPLSFQWRLDGLTLRAKPTTLCPSRLRNWRMKATTRWWSRTWSARSPVHRRGSA